MPTKYKFYDNVVGKVLSATRNSTTVQVTVVLDQGQLPSTQLTDVLVPFTFVAGPTDLFSANAVQIVPSGSNFVLHFPIAEVSVANQGKYMSTNTPVELRLTAAALNEINDAVSASVTQAAAFTNAVDGLRSDVPALAAHAAMPSSSRFISLSWPTPGSNLEYVAPADGYVSLLRQSGAIDEIMNLSTRANGVLSISSYAQAAYANQYMSCLIPVKKGTSVSLACNLTGTGYICQFVYADGAQ